MNNLRLTASAALLALGLISVTGCGNSIEPGEYRIYKMDAQAAEKSSGCYPKSTPDPNDKFDADTTLKSSIWVMTADSFDNIFLDLGTVTLLGTASDAGYTFKGKVINVEFEDNDSSKTKVSTTTTTTIDTTIDGKSLGATAVTTSSFACTNSTEATPCPTVKIEDCTETQQFSGTQIDDVELQYPVK